MTAREEILGRIRSALGERPGPGPLPDVPASVPRGPAPGAVLDLLTERLTDYRASVVRTGTGGLAATLADVLGGAVPVVPPGLPPEWGVAGIVDSPGLTADDLDAAPCVLTACALAIAVTGTIVLDHGPDQGRRALTLVPDRHVCVVRADQVVVDVPDALARLDAARPLTFVSGPSATSDIELQRVEGVHGPRTLQVILTGPQA
jgi:L-lactate dehydrogenase complex protein LldG